MSESVDVVFESVHVVSGLDDDGGERKSTKGRLDHDGCESNPVVVESKSDRCKPALRRFELEHVRFRSTSVVVESVDVVGSMKKNGGRLKSVGFETNHSKYP